MNRKENNVLLILDPIETDPVDIAPEEGKAVADILAEFTRSYGEKDDDVSDGDWLLAQFRVSLPDRDEAELTQMRNEIIDGLHQQEEAKKSLDEALSRGMRKESWFVRECKKATSAMSARESAKYLQDLDNNILKANQEWQRTLIAETTHQVSQNPSLDGFIAEQWHAQTFNANAVAKDSPYRAEVVFRPDGARYGKNSVDIQIKNIETDEIVENYQVKYYKDANATERAFANGDYRGQRKLVPSDQVEELGGKYTDRLKAPDGTTSNPFSKTDARIAQEEAQSGNWKDWNWDKYATKDLVVGIAKNTRKAGAMGLCFGAGFELVRQIYNDEEIDVGKIVEEGLKSGADFGIKTALAGGLKVAAEKGFLSTLLKGISCNACTAIAFTAVENVKVMRQVASGELTPMEGLEKAEQVTVSTVCGLMASTKGAAIGGTIGLVLGPIGVAVGSLLGGFLGWMAGSGGGETVVRGYQEVRKVIIKKGLWEGSKEIVNEVWEGIKSVGRPLNPLSWA